MAAKAVLNVIAPLREIHSDLEDDAGASGSDEEVESSDESKHENLLKAIDSLADKSKKRNKVGQRSEPNHKVSEFHLSSSGDKDERVALHDLVGALQNKSGYGSLKKKLDSMHKKSGVLDVPLSKPEAEKIQRTVAFDETSKDISKWAPTVKKNREAEHLSFPLKPYVPPKTSTRTLAANFKPRTPLEEEIAAVLQGSSHLMERKNKELTEEEEQALLAMDLEEAKERRHELQKLRALQSYYEAKCRRAKKIKSKKYHREKRKAEKRSAMKLSGGDIQDDPEKANEELEKAERLHAEERVSLKHRNTSKWAKNLMLKGNKNLEARKALQEQLHISRNLTEKKVESEEEEEETPSKEEVEAGNITSSTFGTLVTDQENPWGIEATTTPTNNITTGEHSAPSSKFRRLQPVTGEAADMEQALEESDAEEVAKSDDEFELQLAEAQTEEVSARKKRKASTEGKEDLKQKKTGGKKRGKEVSEGLQGKEIKGKDKQKKDKKKKKSLSSPLQVNKKSGAGENRRKNSLPNNESETEDGISDNELLEHDKQQGSKDSGPIIDVLEEEENVHTEKGGQTNTKKVKELNVDPKKFFRFEDDGLIVHSSDVGGTNLRNEQRLNIQQAFANDDVIEEFTREKADTEEAAKPKDLDLTLPGWGDWAGAGLKVSEKKKKFVIPAAPAPTRKDSHLAHVIINEGKDKHFAKNQVTSLPHPYTSQVQFECSIRNPVGKHWNTNSTVSELTKPRVTTLVGTIIDPIKPTKEIKRRKPQEVQEGGTKQKRQKKKSAGSSLTIHN